MYYLLRGLAYLVLRLFFVWTGGAVIVGRENVPRRGGLIVAPNHLSHLDPLLVGVALPRHAWFVATDELFEFRILGWLARRLRAFPIRQDSADRQALRKTEALLAAGHAVVIFPEGHESLDGRLQPLQGGTVLLALKTGVPIVPVAIQGTSAIMPPRSFGIRRPRRPVRLVFGRPIAPETLAGGLRKRSAVDHGVNLLTAELLALIGQCGQDPQEPPREQSEGMASDTGMS